MNIPLVKNILWLSPFLFFVLGYQTLNILYRPQPVVIPDIVGKQTAEALRILSSLDLYPRIKEEKIDADMPDGTILSQSPHPGQMVKPHQSLFIVVSKKPENITMPLCTGKSYTDVEKILKDLGIRPKTYYIASNYVRDSVIAQFPASGEMLSFHQRPTLYIGKPYNYPSICPDMKGKKLDQVEAFLKERDLAYSIVYTQHDNKSASYNYVLQQKPLPGTFLYPDKPVTIILQVGPQTYHKAA